MRVLVVSNIFHPDQAGGAAVHSDFCFRLVAQGHEVEVHTAYPYYPEWKNKTGANLWRRRLDSVNGIPVLRHGLYLPRSPTGMKGRLLQEASFLASLLRSIFHFRRPDVVVAISPLLSAVVYGWLVAKLNRAKLWVNVQDIMSDAAQAAGFGGNGPMLRLARKAEDFALGRARVVSTIAPKMVRRLEERLNRPVLLFPNWLNASMAGAVEKHGPKRLGKRFSPPQLLYAGNIGRKQALVELRACLEKTDTNSGGYDVV